PYSDNFNVKDSLTSILPPQNYYAETGLALKNREEYKMLNKAIEAEELQKKLINGELLPQLAVGVGGMYLDMMDQDNTYGLAFATLSIPISDWWGGAFKRQEHKIKIEIAKNNLDQNSELLQLQMSKTYKDLMEAYKQIEISQTSVNQAAEYQKEMEDNYDAGLTSLSDLLEARAITQQAKDAFIDSKTKYKITIAKYLQAIGKAND
ncbi:MAG: TolC family protein, partial [Flavobacteriaceae bacterium]|nr:TolC family protein [Flavobacteriaceae bacterium]